VIDQAPPRREAFEKADAARGGSEDRYRALFESSRDAMMVLAPPEWNFVAANRATLELFGVKNKAAFLALAPWNVSPATQPDGSPSGEKALAMIEIALNEGAHCFEWRHLRLDGREIHASVQLTRLELAGQTLLQATMRDLSPTERALSALRDSQERLRLAVEATGMGTYLWDHATGKVDYSPELLALYGLPPDGALALGPDRVPLAVLDEDRPIFRANMMVVGNPREGGVTKAEFRIRRQDGSIHWLMAWGRTEFDGTRPSRSAGIIMDITGRKSMENALRESESRFRSLFENSPLAIVLTRGVETLYLNKMFQEVFALDGVEALVGQSILACVAPECREEILERTRQRALGSPMSSEYEITGLRPDGSKFPIRVAVAVFQLPDGQATLFFITDLSERKRAEDETAKLMSQLQQAQKMESVGRLAGGVAHDFNNMLGVILGHSELALEKVDSANSLHGDLVSIRTAAQRSADLTRQLLAFARKQTVVPKVLNLNDTVAGMLKMVRRLIGEDVVLEWRPGEPLWPVLMDAAQIDQILANLCVNARDAIANVGKITIETGAKTIGEAVPATLVGAAPGDYVWIAVRDDGCGMAQTTMSHIFEPFFTTKEVGKGTGLGLATVYGIVKQNNGFIELHSELGLGTVFTLYLPRHVGKSSQGREAAGAGTIQQCWETILLVEDEAPLLQVARRMLEKRGYKVLTASTPGQAIQIARKHTGNIDLLMTDVVMPEMNGRDLAKSILSLYPRAKRLFMSGYTADVIAHQGVLDEGVCFIQKPFSANDMAAMVSRVLSGGSEDEG